jgi:lysozyme family protein
VNDRRDPGGETKYGISKRSYPRLNIKALSLNAAIDVYWEDWWNRRMKWLLGLEDVVVAGKLFDIGINVGERRVARVAQLAHHCW